MLLQSGRSSPRCGREPDFLAPTFAAEPILEVLTPDAAELSVGPPRSAPRRTSAPDKQMIVGVRGLSAHVRTKCRPSKQRERGNPKTHAPKLDHEKGISRFCARRRLGWASRGRRFWEHERLTHYSPVLQLGPICEECCCEDIPHMLHRATTSHRTGRHREKMGDDQPHFGRLWSKRGGVQARRWPALLKLGPKLADPGRMSIGARQHTCP